jgi:hypothetical protein
LARKIFVRSRSVFARLASLHFGLLAVGYPSLFLGDSGIFSDLVGFPQPI